MQVGISVLLSFYKGQRYFKEQFESIIIQMEKSDEVIIRDDGSDASHYLNEIIFNNMHAYSLFKDGKIILLNGENVGVNKSFSKLLARAKHPVSVFCDQDDIWRPGRLESARRHSNSAVHCVNYCVDGKSQLPTLHRRTSCSTLLRNFVPGCCMSGKSKYLLDIISRLPDSVIYDHALLYLSLSAGDNVTFDDEVLVNYRRHSETVTKFGSFVPNGILSAIQLRYRLLELKKELT